MFGRHYGKKNDIQSKSTIDKEVDGFRNMQDMLLGFHVEKQVGRADRMHASVESLRGLMQKQ